MTTPQVMSRIFSSLLVVAISCGECLLSAQESNDEARRQAAIAEFTRKTREANYPALFDQAATEFNVPADILKGIAFAETRWEHLTWPPGETVSPENGMPRPYGIMSLWDNSFFGHSLTDAAALINQPPEVLKADPLQNIRGAAALLRKLYDENPKPDGTAEKDIESWRNAIRKYCGIPEPELNAQHALNVYVFMSQGFHQYGIEWDAHPVNLQPMRDETARIIAAERARRGLAPSASTNAIPAKPAQNQPANVPSVAPIPKSLNDRQPAEAVGSAKKSSIWIVVGSLLVLLWAGLLLRRRRSNSRDINREKR